jgi:CelD/BcsL family acetyltransferase involved in cellulose biosynthesis
MLYPGKIQSLFGRSGGSQSLRAPAPYVQDNQLGITVEAITEERHFLALEPAWRNLLSASEVDNVFCTFEWLSSWWQSFGRAKRLLVVTARRNGRLVGLAPFVVTQREGFRQAALMGGHVTDYKDFIIDASEDRSTLLERMLKRVFMDTSVDVLQVSGLREDSPNFGPLQAVLPRLHAHRATCFASHHAPYIKTFGTWDEYWTGLGRKFRNNTRRQREKLEAAYDRVEFTSPVSAAEASAYLETFFRLKTEHWRAKRAHAVIEDPAVQRFYHAAMQRARSAGWLKIMALQVCGEVAAVDVGMEYGGKYYSCQHTFNDRFEAYSVGRLLDMHIFQDAFARKQREVDLLLGTEPYKLNYHPDIRTLHTLVMFQPGTRGWMAEAWFRRLRPQLERTAQRHQLMKPVREWARRVKVRKG